MTLRLLLHTGALAVLPLAAAHAAAAQIIVGTVVDDLTGAPLAATTIMLLDSADTAVRLDAADSAGWFVLQAPSPARYRLFADRIGYEEVVSDTLEVAGGPRTEVEIRMTPRPVELEAIVVSAERRQLKLEQKGFYRRQEVSPGYFLDTDDILEQRPFYTTDLMRQIPGVRVLPDQPAFGYTVSSNRGFGRVCPMRIVLDGWPLDLMGQTLDDFVGPNEIIGIEVYPGAGGAGAPGRYRGPQSFCGIIMIWTR